MTRFRVHPAVRDLALAAGISFTNFVAGFLLVSIVGRLMGMAPLAEYLLLRRVTAWIHPLATLGIGLGLARYVAYSSRRCANWQFEYFVAALLLQTACLSICGAALWIGRVPLGGILFGHAQSSSLILPLFVLIASGGMNVALYSLFRGRLDLKRSWAMQFCVAIAPILCFAFLFRTGSVALIASVMGISILTITFVFMVPDIREMKRIRFGDVRSRAVDLLRFSIPRVPGSVADAALLAGIPVLASHFIPVSSVAYLLVGASLLSATTLSTEPLSLVFLSKITMMQADDRHEELGKFLAYLMSAIVDVSVYFAIQLLVFTQLFLQLWVGPGILNGVGTIRLIVIGIPFYLFYTGLRSAVDAGSVTAHNTRNLAVSLTAMAIMLFGSIKFLPQHKLLDAFAISLVLTLAVTALTTKLSLRRLYGVRTQWRDSLLPIGFAIVLGLIASLFNQVGSWIWLVTFQICSGLIFLALCFYSKVGWLQYLWILAWRERIRVSTSNAVAQA